MLVLVVLVVLMVLQKQINVWHGSISKGRPLFSVSLNSRMRLKRENYLINNAKLETLMVVGWVVVVVGCGWCGWMWVVMAGSGVTISVPILPQIPTQTGLRKWKREPKNCRSCMCKLRSRMGPVAEELWKEQRQLPSPSVSARCAWTADGPLLLSSACLMMTFLVVQSDSLFLVESQWHEWNLSFVRVVLVTWYKFISYLATNWMEINKSTLQPTLANKSIHLAIKSWR